MKRFKRMMIVMVGILVMMGVAAPCYTVIAEEKKEDISTILANDKRFHTLSTLLQAAGLVDVLEGEGPYTVFAPTDEAFKALPAETFGSLIKRENKEKLEDILMYHVYPRKVTKEDAMKLLNQELSMLNNKDSTIRCKDGVLYINNAKIILTDIKADNGIIHMIDAVLLPEE